MVHSVSRASSRGRGPLRPFRDVVLAARRPQRVQGGQHLAHGPARPAAASPKGRGEAGPLLSCLGLPARSALGPSPSRPPRASWERCLCWGRAGLKVVEDEGAWGWPVAAGPPWQPTKAPLSDPAKVRGSCRRRPTAHITVQSPHKIGLSVHGPRAAWGAQEAKGADVRVKPSWPARPWPRRRWAARPVSSRAEGSSVASRAQSERRSPRGRAGGEAPGSLPLTPGPRLARAGARRPEQAPPMGGTGVAGAGAGSGGWTQSGKETARDGLCRRSVDPRRRGVLGHAADPW